MKVRTRLESEELSAIRLSAIVLGELEFGAEKSAYGERNRALGRGGPARAAGRGRLRHHPALRADTLVDLTKLRWRIERDYQELKQEVGLGHFEGRGWRGFHHHATLCIAAYGFLISERETIPPSASPSVIQLQAPRLPKDYRPRGAAATHRTSHSKLHRKAVGARISRC